MFGLKRKSPKRNSPKNKRNSNTPHKTNSPKGTRTSPSVRRSAALGQNWYGPHRRSRSYLEHKEGPLMRMTLKK